MMKIYLAGDSLVKDYKEEEFVSGWGQHLRQMCDVEVCNYAEGGRSSRLFINEGRLQRIEEQIKKGDYLFIEFCHNDDATKDYQTMVHRLTPLGSPDADGRFPIIPGELVSKRYLPEEYLAQLQADGNITNSQAVIESIYEMLDAYPASMYYPYSADGSKGTYKWFLKQYVDVAREKGAIPVFVTAPARTVFTEEGAIKDGPALHGGNQFAYIRAMKQLAEEAKVPCIDLFALSKELFENVGPEKIHLLTSIKNGIGKGRWPEDFNKEMEKPETIHEDTHMNQYGAYLLTCRLVENIQKSENVQLADLKKHIIGTELPIAKPAGL